ncbi:Tat pathway signal sequence domain protein, partial [Acetobacteraceae bacterium AT-5844]
MIGLIKEPWAMRLRVLLGTTAAAAALAIGLSQPAGAQAPSTPAPTASQAPRAVEGAEAMAAHRAAYRLRLG